MTVEEAIDAFRARFMEALAVDPRDVEERVAAMLEDRPDVEAVVATVGITRVFVRPRGGAWRSRYAWTLEAVEELVGGVVRQIGAAA